MFSSALLIDDDPVTAILNKRIIQRINKDINVIIKDDVEEALEYLKDNINPHVIFLDLNMPGKDGIDFLSEYKKLKLDSKVIILTSIGVRPSVLTKLSELDCNQIFIKPLSEEKLNSLYGTEIRMFPHFF
jgi:response regulator of citrate/malate metabolism